MPLDVLPAAVLRVGRLGCTPSPFALGGWFHALPGAAIGGQGVWGSEVTFIRK